MREQLIQYVNLLFAGAPDSDEIRQEILQNTLDRYDDLVSQGKSPEAAYRLAISGIGDINEILGSAPSSGNTYIPRDNRETAHEEEEDVYGRKNRAAAIAMYILSPVPLFILTEFGLNTMGLCLTILLVAAATYQMVLLRKKSSGKAEPTPVQTTPQQELKKSISNLIWAIGLAVYFILSFTTKAWAITWIIFPIIAAAQGLANAIIDLKEASSHEN